MLIKFKNEAVYIDEVLNMPRFVVEHDVLGIGDVVGIYDYHGFCVYELTIIFKTSIVSTHHLSSELNFLGYGSINSLELKLVQ